MSADLVPVEATRLSAGPYRWNRDRWEVYLDGASIFSQMGEEPHWAESNVLADHDEASGLALIGACPWASAVESV